MFAALTWRRDLLLQSPYGDPSQYKPRVAGAWRRCADSGRSPLGAELTHRQLDITQTLGLLEAKAQRVADCYFPSRRNVRFAPAPDSSSHRPRAAKEGALP